MGTPSVCRTRNRGRALQSPGSRRTSTSSSPISWSWSRMPCRPSWSSTAPRSTVSTGSTSAAIPARRRGDRRHVPGRGSHSSTTCSSRHVNAPEQPGEPPSPARDEEPSSRAARIVAAMAPTVLVACGSATDDDAPLAFARTVARLLGAAVSRVTVHADERVAGAEPDPLPARPPADVRIVRAASPPAGLQRLLAEERPELLVVGSAATARLGRTLAGKHRRAHPGRRPARGGRGAARLRAARAGARSASACSRPPMARRRCARPPRSPARRPSRSSSS